VAAWAIQAVKDLAPVTVLTFDAITPDDLNARFGTNLQAGDFEVVRCRFPSGRTGQPRWTLLKLHWLMRRCKRWPDRRVLFFSTSSEMDFGQPGVQYVDFPQFAERATREMGLFPPQRWVHRSSWLRAAYLQVGRMLSGFSEKGVRANLTLTVSDWTGEIVRKVYGIATKTVYPPVTLEFPSVPFLDREKGFVCVGRIAPSKRILEIMRILGAVREQGHDVHLHVIGPPGEPAYMRKVLATARSEGSWISIEGPLERARLAELIARHRFGIHGMPNEHFGLAVAEMAKAGCIVFVPKGGGQTEIVDYDKRVIYEDEGDAVEKITQVLVDERLQVKLGQEMAARGRRFAPERFVRGVQEAVTQFM